MLTRLKRIVLGLALALLVAVLSESVLGSEPWVGFAAALFVWTVLTDEKNHAT